MTYIKQTWTDGAPGGTPLSAARLNHMEDGVAAAQVAADLDADAALLVANTGTATGAALSTTFVSVVTPEAYGAEGDGTTDDLAAFTAAIATMAPGDTLRLTKGKTYLLSDGLAFSDAANPIPGATLDGGGATLQLSAGAAAGTIMLLCGSTGDRVTIRDCVFDLSAASGATGIRLKGGHQSVRGNTFLTPGAGGVYFETCSDAKVIGNHFEGAGYGVCALSTAIVTRPVIAHNTFEGGATGDAIELNTPSGLSSGFSITGNVISGYTNTAGQGIGIGVANGAAGAITGNTITGCGLDGIHIESGSTKIAVTGNVITDCQRSGVSVQPGPGAAPDHVSIVGNVIEGCGTGDGSGGIAIEGATSGVGHVITSNVVRSCGHAAAAAFYGIDLGVGASEATVTANAVSNTNGVTSAGIRFKGLSKSIVSGNICWDDQGTKTQGYGVRAQGVLTEVMVIGNNLNGNMTGPFDEGGLLGSSANYQKQLNRPTSANNAPQMYTKAGAISDADFAPYVPADGSFGFDTTNLKLMVRSGGSWVSTAALT